MKRSLFLNELKARGFVYQTTNLQHLTSLLNSANPLSAYIGFDCTAPSLHIGNLMQIMLLRLLQKHSIKPIVIVGGTTSKIGDPSGRDIARNMLTDETIEKNMHGIKKSLQKFIIFDEGPYNAILLNNADWLEDLRYIKFLRDYGTYFSVNKMLSFEKIKLRLQQEQNLSFLEFNYSILQAYDFLHLNKNYNCVIQFGGSDQWGNIISGVELVKKATNKDVFGITTPLVTTASGAKMGKSAKGAMWLNENMLTPYDYYQFWRNTDDRDVIKFMKIYTDISLEQINDYEKNTHNSINELKKLLAYETTKLCHGTKNAKLAQEAATKMFEKGDTSNLPEFQINIERVKKGIPTHEVLKDTKLTSSKGEAKRLIKGGGARLNRVSIIDENHSLCLSDFENGYAILSSGKKKHIKLTITPSTL